MNEGGEVLIQGKPKSQSYCIPAQKKEEKCPQIKESC